MISKFIYILLFTFSVSSVIWGQFAEEITEKNSELDELRSEIKKLEDELAQLSEKEKVNLSVLKKIDKQKATQRKNRGKMVRVALVGYTNVGKSTLMNLLSKS